MNKKVVILSSLLLAAVILAGGVFWYTQNESKVTNQPTINEVANTNQPINTNQPVEGKTYEIIPPTKTDCTDELDTNCWNTYRNSEYGFEFKYPGGWKAEISDNNSQKIYINSNDFNRNQYNIINQGVRLGILFSKNISGDTSLSNKFDFGMQVGPLKEVKDVIINSMLAKEFIFEGLNSLASPENKDMILSTYLKYVDKNIILSFDIYTGGLDRYNNFRYFQNNILPTFKFSE